ncbi:MAG: glycoside hydrolase family 2, partial [Bacteroidales bacterium]|nr:glycoside hydrolase family 2 [Bacteroidales bacterium]
MKVNRFLLIMALLTLFLPMARVASQGLPGGGSEAGIPYYPVRDRLEVTSLDGTWQFKLEDAREWRSIQVPGNWETQGVKVPEYGRRLSEMTGIYRRTFDYQDDWRGRDVVLRLDGVQHGFKVFVNGTEAGSGHSGHTMHQFCITPCLKEGQNEIRIEVSTHSEYWLFDVCDAWSYTGIKRSVELFSVPREASLADVIFTSKVNQDESADIVVSVKVNSPATSLGSPFTVTASLLDERYNHVADMRGVVQDGSASMTAHVARPRLWNAETPNLYRLDVKLLDVQGRKLQSVEEKVGIREVRVEGCKILLNNREIFLRGVCLSENDAIEGGAMTPMHRRRQLEQMKAANINFIRTAHYPLDPVVMRLCDEMGFYVCEEIPFASRGDEYLKTNDAAVIAELKSRARATIDRDRNCPSIIMWSHGNENKIYPCQDSVLRFTKQYDPTRLRGVPQAKGAFQSFIERPSAYVDVICGHYANDDVLADACKKSELPIINTEYAHSLGTAFGDLEHKYDIFRREPKIAGGSVWCYQDQSVL